MKMKFVAPQDLELEPMLVIENNGQEVARVKIDWNILWEAEEYQELLFMMENVREALNTDRVDMEKVDIAHISKVAKRAIARIDNRVEIAEMKWEEIDEALEEVLYSDPELKKEG